MSDEVQGSGVWGNYCVYGDIGAGKTYTAVEKFIIPLARQGWDIVCNMSVNESALMWEGARSVRILKGPGLIECLSRELDDEEGKSLKVKPRTLIVVDEAQQLLDVQGTYKNDLKKVYTFVEMSRHSQLCVVFITQNPARFNSQIVRVCNHFIRLKNMGIFGWWFKGAFCRQYRDKVHGPIITSSYGNYSPLVFRFYKSVGDNVEASSGNGPVSWQAAALIPVFLLLVLFGVPKFLDGFGMSKLATSALPKSTVSKPAAVGAPAPSAGSAPVVAPPRDLRDSPANTPPRLTLAQFQTQQYFEYQIHNSTPTHPYNSGWRSPSWGKASQCAEIGGVKTCFGGAGK